MLVIRPAAPQDVPAVFAIERAVFGDPPYPDFFFRQAVDMWPEQLLLAEADCGVVGYLLSCPAGQAGEAWIMSLGVLDSARGQGTGKRLLIAALDGLKNRGCKTALLTAHPDNPAVGLYQRHGFQVDHLDPAYFGTGEPRLLMRCQLG